MAIKALFTSPIICLLLVSLATASIEDVCKMASSNPEIKYDFCVASLKSSPGSGSATNQGLAIIAGNLAVKQAAVAKSKVDLLLKKLANPRMKIPLQDCDELYDNAIAVVTDAIKAVKNSKLEDALAGFEGGADAPSTCEGGFEELHLECPLSKENDAMLQLTSIALAIATNLMK